MVYLFLFVLEIVLLFFLSRNISKLLSRYLSIGLLSVLFLPGVIVHELSHLFVALILFVRVGEMEFTPKVTEGKLKLGSVQIEKTDPIRRAVIGFAPIFVGLILILMTVYFFEKNLPVLKSLEFYAMAPIVIGIIYTLFVISNTMFSSAKDMEGTIELTVAFAIIFVALYIVGFRVPIGFVGSLFNERSIGVLQEADIFLLASIFIDLFILGAVKLFKKD